MKYVCSAVIVISSVVCSTLASKTSAIAQVPMPQVGFAWREISPDQTLRIVSQFAGTPIDGLSVTFSSPNTAPKEIAQYHVQDGKYKYVVDKYTGTVSAREDTDFYVKRAEYATERNGTNDLQIISQRYAEQIALAYLEKHYPEPELLTHITTQLHFPLASDGSGQCKKPDYYRASFLQMLPGEIYTPSKCFIDVDAVHGNIVSYRALYYPVLISTSPKLTGPQAMKAAMDIMLEKEGKAVNVDCLRVLTPDPDGVERLAYVVNFSGFGPIKNGQLVEWNQLEPPVLQRPSQFEQYEHTYTAVVDANTGEVLGWE